MTLTITIIISLIIIGFFSGMLSGLLGVGGGIIIVPCLVFFLAFNQKMAQGTSLALLTIPVVILGMLQYYKEGYVDFRVVVFLAIGFIVGAFFGGKIAISISEELLRKIFSVVLLIVALKLFFSKPTNKKVETKVSTSSQQIK